MNSNEEKAIKEATKYQKDVDEDEKTNSAIWVVIILALLTTCGSVTYCKMSKKCCFAEKDDAALANEGGESDRSLFKKEVKSKNSHKKHSKESLMPAFKVTEEQA